MKKLARQRCEFEVPPTVEPIAVLARLRRERLAQDYFFYTSDAGVVLAMDVLARVTVSATAVRSYLRGELLTSDEPDDPLRQVRECLQALPFLEWRAWGYIAFDFSRFYFPYERTMDRDLLEFVVPKYELDFHVGRIVVNGYGDADAIEKVLADIDRLDSTCAKSSQVPGNNSQKPGYLNMVNRLTASIGKGKLAKAIISRRMELPGDLDLIGTYLSGSVNQAERSYCFQLRDVGGVGYTPEVFLKADDTGGIETCLLAGTRPRGSDPAEDQRLQEELFTSAKEMKEHAMSVRLAQEEMRACCRASTIRIFDFMEMHKFSCVQHLATKISGSLQIGLTMWDAVRTLFPAITVSGIPKADALREINELEPLPRGIYGGVVGWVDYADRADLALAIRSVFQYGDFIHVNAGAGIVAESLDENEYAESVNKMNTMLSHLVLTNWMSVLAGWKNAAHAKH